MREVISNFLAKNASENKNFYVMSGDHGYALFDELIKKAPEQFINTGVTEQAMVGAAAGMAKTGKKVVIYGLASFIPIRVLEFIKMNICYEKLPVIILGDGAGTVYTTLGASHQCGEDIACLKTLPIKIFSPADKHEMKLCLDAAFAESMPTYIRIGKSDKPEIHTTSSLTKISSAISLTNQSNTTAIFATGSMVSTGKELATKYKLSLYSCPILNFYDQNEFLDILKLYKNIITLEEHSVHGGFGSSIADLIAENGLNLKLKKFGITEYFTKGCGSYEYATKFHKLDLISIEEKLKSLKLI
ncbi:MAG: transketolase [Bacteriovorax sp.]|nr:transketolase [Bacteriovorax sp.]